MMRRFLILFCIATLSFAGCKKNIPHAAAPLYSVSSADYRHDYGDAVSVVSTDDQFVICDSCQRSAPLERSLKPVPLSIQFSAPFSQPSSTAAVAVLPGKPTDPVPGSLSPNQVVPMSAPSTTPKKPQVEIIKQPAVSSFPASTIASLPTSSATNSCDASLEKTVSPANSESKNILTTVYFPLGSAALDQVEKKKILKATNTYKGKSIVVTGFTCKAGSQQINDRLAMDRAIAVANVLKQDGVTPIMVSGSGRCCYISDDQRLNRRVEIRITGD